MRWVGVDLGLQTAAIAVVTGSPSGPWALESVKVLNLPAGTVAERLEVYRLWLKEQITTLLRSDVAGVFAETPFAGKNIRSALLLGTLQGVTWALLQESGTPSLQMLASTDIKKALTGRGSATKAQVAAWLAHYLLPETPLPKNHHATDAIAIAIAGALTQNSPITRTFTSRADR